MGQIAVGLILGFAVMIISHVWNNDSYPKYQQWLISVSILFPPLMVVLLLLFYLFNKVSSK
jgi:purine-cytosine permease-like protein